MADEDQSQKTEEPSEKKLAEAYKQGQVPKSQEFTHWMMLSASGLVLTLFASSLAQSVTGSLVTFLAMPHELIVDQGGVHILIAEIGWRIIELLLLPVGFLVVAAIAANMLQHKPIFAPAKLAPKLNKISPMNGLKRLFGWQSVIDLLKAVAKIGIVGTVMAIVVWPDLAVLPVASQFDLVEIAGLVKFLAIKLGIAVTIVMLFIAGLDIMYQRFDFTKGQRMSKRELKDETKQSDGDPQVRARIRQVRMDRARRRMMTAVPDADVIITNPTHFAVALAYDGEAMAAPKLVAKGQDHLALRIREMGEEHDVPIVENPPLARSLYAGVEIDQEIPPDFYKAVAEVISYVMQLRSRSYSRRAR